MNITLITILLSAGALFFGVLVGYYLRVIVALGKRRSIEIDIKQMMVGAKEEAQRITDEAKKKSEEQLGNLKEEEKKKEEKLDRRAKDILATSIQRLASSTASELMTTVVSIPNNEIKGKIIGK